MYRPAPCAAPRRRARQLDDAEADQHLGRLRAHHPRSIDQPRQSTGASARSRSPIVPSARTADARTIGSGSAAAPISALTMAGVTWPPAGAGRRFDERSRRHERRLALRTDVCLCAAVPRRPATTDARCNPAALARTSRPCDRSTASRASAGSVPRRPIRRDTSCRPATPPCARRSPSPHHSVHLLRRPLGRAVVVTRRARVRERRTARCSRAPAAGRCDRAGGSAAASSRRSCGS